MLRPLKLIPSGVQSWHRDTIAASGDSFAYCSTMSLHIFRLRDNVLHKMIAAHERPISSICWCPDDNNLLASCSIGLRIAIWDLENEEEKFAVKVADTPWLLDWACSGDKLVCGTEGGSVMLWEYKANKLTKLFSVPSKSMKVLRWHPKNANKLLCGIDDGSLIVYNHQAGKKVQIVGKSKTSKDAVQDAQWDPLSEEYLLVAFLDGSLTLYDASTQKEIHSFDKQSQGIKSLAWAKAQPGNFVTATDRVGLLRLWNVSQRSQLSQLKVGTSGVLCVKAVPSEPNWFVLSFKNSSVGVCDLAARTMRFLSSPGHAETIFDVAFHPTDHDLIGTASYDGQLKLWRISTTESHRVMNAGKDQLYGLSFGPKAERVCAVSGTGSLMIWKCSNGEQVVRQQLHEGQAYRCEWNLRGHMQIATGGADGNACIVDPTNGNIVRKLVHPKPVYGVTWHPMQDTILATGCQDGNVRVYNLADASSSSANAMVTLQGHESRVFNIVFHPLIASIICSGSDDKTIRVWNWTPSYAGHRELRRLTGHASYVRGLLWHSELPHILFSGSWDSTIRVWDVAEQKCLHVSYDHHADVYGLALHPQRPFFLVSSSRDTTIRYWIFEDLIRPLMVQAILKPETMAQLLGSGPEEPEACMHADPGKKEAKKLLYGPASQMLATELQSVGAQRPISLMVYRKLLTFFMYRAGIEDLWGLVATIRGDPPTPAAAKSHRGFFHERELVGCQKTKALELASARAQIGIQGKQEERLLKAAQILLRIGDIRGYCKFTAQAGHWERAICIAPAVSQQFWQEMCSEYLESLSAAGDLEEAAPFLIGIGRASKLVDKYIDRSDLDNAFVVAKAESDGLLPTGYPSSSSAAAAPRPPPNPSTRSKLEDVASVLASRYSDQGEPLLAAMCQLAVSKSMRAVSVLSRSHEVVLSFVLAAILDQPHDPMVVKLLAQSLEKSGRLREAAEMLQLHPKGPTMHIPLLAARASRNSEEARHISPITQAQHQELLAQHLAQGNKPGAVLAAACARQDEQAVHLGIEGLMELFARPEGWSLAQARELLDPLESMPVSDMGVKEIASTLACASYVGMVEASMLGYHELMFPLAQTLRNIITHQNLSFPVSLFEITLLEASSISHRLPAQAKQQLQSLCGNPELPQNIRRACEQQIAAIEQRPPEDEWPPDSGPGLLKIAGGHLPACYRRFAKCSVLTNNLIRGPAFELEDRKNFVSLADALGWVRVNAFSPLNTGCRIYPV